MNENESQVMQHTPYYDLYQVRELKFDSSKHFSVLSLNIQSIHAKFLEFEALIEEFHKANIKFNIICLQECWISAQTDLSLMQLSGYDCVSQAKCCSERGGLIMYIDNRFQHKMHLNINMYDKWEGQIVYVSGGGLSKTITIGNIYRPPRMLVADINQFIDELTLVIQSIKCKSINLAGDYNLNLLKINENAACSNFFDMMTSHSLFPQITFPTRLSHTSATLIDNIFCKFDATTKEIKSGILLNNLSDHLPYFILLDIIAFKTPTLKFIKIYPQHNLALRNIISDIHASDLHTDIDHNPTSDPNVTYKKILDVLEKAKHKHMSGKLVKYNKYKHKKSTWLTNGLLKSIRFRDKLYKQMKCILPTSVEYEIIRLNLKTYNNILRKSLFRAKRLFLSYTFNKYKSDIKNTWKSINELLSRNYTNKSRDRRHSNIRQT